MTPETCPNCGADLPPNARSCPECGSDENTGWSDEARYGGLNLPDDDFNYEEFAKREFGKPGKIPHGLHWFWWVVAILIVIAFVIAWVL